MRLSIRQLPLAGIIFATLGMVYCILMALNIGSSTICITSGCGIIQDFTIFGISPWWAGTLAFIGVLALAIFTHRSYAYIAATIFLLGDILFLVLMFLLAPCTSCLLGALFIFATWFSLNTRNASLVAPRRFFAGTIGFIWLVLIVMNLAPILHENIPDWAISSKNDSKIKIYFSPTCKACIEAVYILADTASFYPIADNEEEIQIIADLQQRTKSGQNFALAFAEIAQLRANNAYKPAEVSQTDLFLLRLRLMHNKSILLRSGYSNVPVIVIEGLPHSWSDKFGLGENTEQMPKDLSPNQNTTPSPTHELPIDFGQTAECGKDKDCP